MWLSLIELKCNISPSFYANITCFISNKKNYMIFICIWKTLTDKDIVWLLYICIRPFSYYPSISVIIWRYPIRFYPNTYPKKSHYIFYIFFACIWLRIFACKNSPLGCARETLRTSNVVPLIQDGQLFDRPKENIFPVAYYLYYNNKYKNTIYS